MGSLRDEEQRVMGTEEEEEEEKEEEEPILKQQNQRFCMFPITYQSLWEMYKKAEASFWTGTTYFPLFSEFSWSFFVLFFLLKLGFLMLFLFV